jgi:hypothetical protein
MFRGDPCLSGPVLLTLILTKHVKPKNKHDACFARVDKSVDFFACRAMAAGVPTPR